MVKDVILRYVREDGKEFVIDGKDYFILGDGLEGLDFAAWEQYTEPLAFREGSIITGSTFTGRPIIVTFMAFSTEDYVREYVRTFFNVHKKYDLYITYKGITRYISGEIEGFNEPTETNYKYTKCTVGLFCPDPYLKAVEDQTKYLEEIVPFWGFPFIATADYSPVFSIFKFGEYVFFKNNGDVATTFNVLLTFKGDVVDPVIYQGFREDNKYFKLIKDTPTHDRAFHDGDYVFIDFDKAVVIYNDEPHYNFVAQGSELLEIPEGGTYLSCTADSGETLLHCRINYNVKYAGV